MSATPAAALSALETWWIPAAASNPGLHGTMWMTDLWLYSRVTDADTAVTATFYSEQGGTAQPVEATIQLPPNATVEITDAVATLFGEHRPGSIRLESEYPFFETSRTVNSGGTAGTFGQGIPAYPVDERALGYTLLGASNRPGPDGVRTNIGIADTGPGTATLNVFVRDPATLDLLGTAAVEVGAFGWFQTDVFELVGVAGQEISIADVSVWPSGGQLVYLSRVDNRSGDGTFIFGSSGDSISIAGKLLREYEIRTSLTYDDGVTVSIQTRQPGGEWSGGSTSFSTQGNSPIDQEFCHAVE